MSTHYKIFINNQLYSYPKGGIKALRASLGFITGFPSDSTSTINLTSKLLSENKAEVYYKGKKVTVTIQEQF